MIQLLNTELMFLHLENPWICPVLLTPADLPQQQEFFEAQFKWKVWRFSSWIYKLVPQFVNAKFVYNSHFTTVFVGDISIVSIVNGVYKLTYNGGGTTLKKHPIPLWESQTELAYWFYEQP